jgi:hypothetical protein
MYASGVILFVIVGPYSPGLPGVLPVRRAVSRRATDGDAPPPVTRHASTCNGSLRPLRASHHVSAAGLSCDAPFGHPVLPVRNTCPLRRATKAPVGTFTHQTIPS